MMETSILNQLPFDPGFLILGLIGLVLILLIFLISTMVQLKSLTRKYDYFMRGKDAETLEDVIMDQIEEIRNLKAEDRAAKDSIRTLNRNFRASFQKFGMVKYNAFQGMGGSIYNIPYKDAGYESGYINTGVKLDYITIITKDKSTVLITAFPSLGNYQK